MINIYMRNDPLFALESNEAKPLTLSGLADLLGIETTGLLMWQLRGDLSDQGGFTDTGHAGEQQNMGLVRHL